MKAELSSWARGALDDEQQLRIRLHLADSWRLLVIGTHPARFTVRVLGPLGVDYDWQRVPKDMLWYTIQKAVALTGHPMEPDEQWAKTREAIRATAE